MDELISRQAAINAIEGLCNECDHDSTWCGDCRISHPDKDAKDVLEALPPAQPEIIRCKDCKHWIPYDWMFSEVWQSKNIADYPEDEIGCNYCDMAMKANDFCSRGEMREVAT